MRSPTPILAFLVLAILSFPGSLQSQVVLEEDFESPDIPNYLTYTAGQFLVTTTNSWAVTLNSIDLYEAAARPEAAAYDGAQAVDLAGSPGAGVMEAVFATQPGAEYELNFHYARNNLLGLATGSARVDVIGTTLLLNGVVAHDPATHAFNEYLPYQGTFTADSTEALLRFTSLNEANAGITIDGVSISAVNVAGIGDARTAEGRDGILDASPNPFHPVVRVAYVIGRRGFVDVSVFDVSGRRVGTLIREVQEAGRHHTTWSGVGEDGLGATPGIYLCVLTTPDGRSARRIVRMR